MNDKNIPEEIKNRIGEMAIAQKNKVAESIRTTLGKPNEHFLLGVESGYVAGAIATIREFALSTDEGMKVLLDLLAKYGGKIVSTNSLETEWINQARASGRLYVDENSLGYVWEPIIIKFPETEEEVDWLERWYPLNVEMPGRLKNPDWLFRMVRRTGKVILKLRL